MLLIQADLEKHCSKLLLLSTPPPPTLLRVRPKGQEAVEWNRTWQMPETFGGNYRGRGFESVW